MELEDVDMSAYTDQQWFDELYAYLRDTMSMTDAQIKQEFETRFPELIQQKLF